MKDKGFNLKEHAKRIEEARLAVEFLKSKEWNELVKPMIDSFILGLKDATAIELNSNDDPRVELKARKLAISYLQDIEAFLQGYVGDGQQSAQMIERKKRSEKIYKPREQ